MTPSYYFFSFVQEKLREWGCYCASSPDNRLASIGSVGVGLGGGGAEGGGGGGGSEGRGQIPNGLLSTAARVSGTPDGTDIHNKQ